MLTIWRGRYFEITAKCPVHWIVKQVFDMKHKVLILGRSQYLTDRAGLESMSWKWTIVVVTVETS